MKQLFATQTKKFDSWLRMDNEKSEKLVYDAKGVRFTVYRVEKLKKCGLKTYWVLVDPG